MSAPTRSEAMRNGGMVASVLVLVSLQIFLLVVECGIAHDPGPSRAVAVFSAILFASALFLRWSLHDD
jgi:hypothetical protein